MLMCWSVQRGLTYAPASLQQPAQPWKICGFVADSNGRCNGDSSSSNAKRADAFIHNLAGRMGRPVHREITLPGRGVKFADDLIASAAALVC